ncbi:thioredoxin reductase (NADPH) [Novosphingobium sp. Rr 2-17]|nr:thioredoxin reductase (NADPH) [Novosphingobium sp. Rr 2-17]
MEDILDCLIVGGGPAGLTAAIYLGRFHLSVEVADAGNSRASLIPLTRNHAGFPDGIAGSELLARMRDQAAKYGARITSATVVSLSKRDDGLFVVTTKETGDRVARSILLATGVVNIRPDIPADIHAAAVENGLLRLLPDLRRL